MDILRDDGERPLSPESRWGKLGTFVRSVGSRHFFQLAHKAKVATGPSFWDTLCFSQPWTKSLGTFSTPLGGRETQQFRIGQCRGLGESRRDKNVFGKYEWDDPVNACLQRGGGGEWRVKDNSSSKYSHFGIIAAYTFLSNSSVRFGFQTFFWMESPWPNLFYVIMYTHVFMKQPHSEFWLNNELKARAICRNKE